jgi:hypothetical protein
MTIISVEGAIGHFNPPHQVLAWVGKFADHQKSGIGAILTLSERPRAASGFLAKIGGVEFGRHHAWRQPEYA